MMLIRSVMTICFASVFAVLGVQAGLCSGGGVVFTDFSAQAEEAAPAETKDEMKADESEMASEDDEDEDEFKGKSCKQRLKAKKKKSAKLRCATKKVSIACPVLARSIAKLEKKCGKKKAKGSSE